MGEMERMGAESKIQNLKSHGDGGGGMKPEGRMLGLLTAVVYCLLTLVPGSDSIVVSWPWVFIWQVGLALPLVWLLWRLWGRQSIPTLGNGWDWLMLLAGIGIVVSTSFAEFPQQARWYGWAALCFLAALYALTSWLETPQRCAQLLQFQGYLGLVFVGLSLLLWVTQTYLPELQRIQLLQQLGVAVTFDFNTLELRNWYPIGHQNYVAGYLLLMVPLFVGLGGRQSGWRRWTFLGGAGLGLVDLYTTGSRGGWLGLMGLLMAGFALALFKRLLPRTVALLSGLGLVAGVAGALLANNRLRAQLIALLTGQSGGEFAYRIITNVTGWRMGWGHPGSGIGLGGVPIAYQHYRPGWAGREAELAYQLHSTPAQLWAEMGIWGALIPLVGLGLLLYHGIRWARRQSVNSATSSNAPLIWSLYGGLLAYSLISLTDYQLDVVSIGGTLVIYGAVLIAEFRFTSAAQQVPLSPKLRQGSRWLASAGLGGLFVVTLWLVPIHRAWSLSSQGFQALNQEALEQADLEQFVQRLTKAHQLAPWQPYYPYQLGWNLGDLALGATEPEQQSVLIRDGIQWLEQGNILSPYQEFGHSNLAWLFLQQDPNAAIQEFAKSAALLPAKRGVFYGLGLSLFRQGQVDPAATAIALEILRDPPLVTSPIWSTADFQLLYVRAMEKLERMIADLLVQTPQASSLNAYLHRIRGSIRWWRNDWNAAHIDLEHYGSSLSQAMLALSQGQDIQPYLQTLPDSSARLAILAWLNPSERPDLLDQAWLNATETAPISAIQQELLAGMQQADTFDQWLKQYAPRRPYRRQREGFGVLSRHADGPAPTDFLVVWDNLAVTQFLRELFPSSRYYPELDQALQPHRDQILKMLGTKRTDINPD